MFLRLSDRADLIVNNAGRTALHEAVIGGYVDAVKAFKDVYTHPNLNSWSSHLRSTTTTKKTPKQLASDIQEGSKKNDLLSLLQIDS